MGAHWFGARLSRALAAFVLGTVLALSGGDARGQDLLVFAAASLKDALDAVIEEYTASGSTAVAASYASSSALARQIERGAPADIFLSANPAWMDYLEERDLIRDGSRADLIGNGLVLVAPAASEVELRIAPGFDLLGALDGGRLAMGDPDHVPAGVYGRAALASLGVWEEVAPQVARADNVRAALVLVTRGEVPLGIVYSSDAVADPGVRVVGVFPPEIHPPIIYPVAVLAESKHPAAADLVEFFKSAAAARVFERSGFTVVDLP
jgi:molybdate transport system substrate-binding protein